ncbi:hypothetical protein QBC32DRAFT_211166, partial [Pseudoneurospora amorphoporcata]
GKTLNYIPRGPEKVSWAFICTSVFNCNVCIGVLLLIGSPLGSPFFALLVTPFQLFGVSLPRTRVSETV